MKAKDPAPNEYQEFLTEIRQRIFNAWHSTARAVNAGLIALNWDLGRRIVETQMTRSWDERAIETVGKELKREFPYQKGFSERNLWYMRAFWQTYSAPDFLQQAAAESASRIAGERLAGSTGREAGAVPDILAQVPWGQHILILDKTATNAERIYYLRATAQFGWTRNVLLHMIKTGHSSSRVSRTKRPTARAAPRNSGRADAGNDQGKARPRFHGRYAREANPGSATDRKASTAGVYFEMIIQPSHPMRSEFDIVAYSPGNHRVLIVECKGGKETSPANAARLRRNLLAHGLIAETPFFLLAFPTALFLWTSEGGAGDLPAFTSPVKPVLRDYLGNLADHNGGLRAESLELAVYSWLSDLASGVREPEAGSEADQMLVRSGLYDQIKRGVVRSDVAS